MVDGWAACARFLANGNTHVGGVEGPALLLAELGPEIRAKRVDVEAEDDLVLVVKNHERRWGSSKRVDGVQNVDGGFCLCQ
jgi:NAD(P)-dependent dehydrogenase (short-subunit alcohol dehydrogenase family)